jgi:autotransporter-associated beta strand protein
MTSTSAATLANDIILANPTSTRYYALQKLAASSTTGTNLELSGTISGGGANMILQLDSATAGDATTSFTLSGNNTLSGQIRLNRGAVILTNAASLGSATLFVQSNGNTTDGNVRFTNSFTLANNITIGVNTNNSFNTGENDVLLSGILSGTGTWGKVGGSGKLTLTNTNTATGAITLSSGTLAIGTGSSLFSTGAFFGAGGTTYVTVNTGATLETRNWGYGAGNALNELRANSASVRVNGGTIRFTETQSALRGFQVGPAGAALEAIADVTFTKLAGTVLSDNIIQGVTSAGSLTLTGAGNGVIEDGIGSYGSWSASAGIIKSGSGTWTLSGQNTFTGNTAVNAGTLRLASPAGRLTFALTGVSNNSVSGDGTAQFDAEFFLNLAAADLTDGNTWTLVNMANATYEDDFTVNSSLGAFTRTGTLHTLTEGENTWVFDEEEGTLTLNPPSGTTYASWIAGFFPDDTTNPAIVGPNADPDKDGVSNALELVFGGNPKDTMDADLMPKIALVTNPGGTVPDGDYLRLTYRRSSASTTAGITTIAEYDSDLNAPWTSATDGVDGVVIITTENGFAAGIDKVETFIPRGSLSTIFGRVKATVP